MGANKLITSTEVAINAIDVLTNNAKMVGMMDKQYNSQFGKEGAKIGSTFNIKRPWRPVVSRVSALVVQAFQEDTVPLTLQYQYQVGLNFTTNELSLSLQNFRKQVLDPAMPAMASAMDVDALTLVLNSPLQIGTAGTTPGTSGWSGSNILLNYSSPDWPLFAGALLDGMCAPRDGRRKIILNQWAMAQTVKGLSGLYQPASTIGDQYKAGVMTNALDFDWTMDQNVITLLTGTRSTSSSPLVYGASQTGANLITNGWGANVTINAGEIIMLSGIYHVNPENQKPITNYNATFVVTAQCQADSSGNMTIPIYPSIVPSVATSGYGTVSASPATGATITLLSGTASTYYPINAAFHGDFATMATADLVMPNGVDFAARESYKGISILIVRAYDITNTQFPARCDVLAGYAATRPELLCRVSG